MNRKDSRWAALVLALATSIPALASAQDDEPPVPDVDVEDTAVEDIDAEDIDVEDIDVEDTAAEETAETAGADTEPPPPPPPPPPLEDDAEGGDGVASGAAGGQRYARQGVLELGGNIGLSWTERLFSLAIEPQLGLFVIENVEVSVLFDFRYVTTEDGDGRRTDSTRVMLLLEPSYHFPVSNEFFLMAGLGLGVGYDGLDAGFAVAPRVGVNIVIGTGVLTPAAQLTYVIGGVEDVSGRSVITATPSFGLNLGYTILL